MTKTVKAVPKLEEESCKDRLQMGQMVNQGKKRPQATQVCCGHWPSQSLPPSEGRIGRQEKEGSKTGRNWGEGRNLKSPDWEGIMACCLCFREAVWQEALLSTQGVWNLECSGVVEAEV